MKKLCALWVFLALTAFAACRRQQTEEQENANVPQREARLNAREKAPATTMTPSSSALLSASPENRHAFESQAQKFQPRRMVPMTSPITETPASTPRSSEPPPR